METNIISIEQFKAFVEMQKSLLPVAAPLPGGGSSTIQIVLIIVGALGGIFTAIASWIASSAASSARENTLAIKASQTVQEEETKKIHIAVNSRDTASVLEIKQLNERNGEMMKMLATLQEKLSGMTADRDQTVRVPAVPASPAVPLSVGVAAPPALPAAPAPASPAGSASAMMKEMATSVSEATSGSTDEQVKLLKDLLEEIKQYKSTPAEAKKGADPEKPALRTTT